MPVTITTTVHDYMRLSAFCFVKHSRKKIAVLSNMLVTNRTDSAQAGLADWIAVGAAVYITKLVIYLILSSKNLGIDILARLQKTITHRALYKLRTTRASFFCRSILFRKKYFFKIKNRD